MGHGKMFIYFYSSYWSGSIIETVKKFKELFSQRVYEPCLCFDTSGFLDSSFFKGRNQFKRYARSSFVL